MHLKPVTQRLAGLSHRLLGKILLGGAPKLLILGAALAGATFALDFLLHLPAAARGVLLAISLVVLCLAVYRNILRPLSRKPSMEDLALLAEAAEPEIKDQLISALQLERDLEAGRTSESPEMIRALVEDTVQKFQNHDFAKAVELRSCVRPMLLGLGAIAALVIAATLAPAHAKLWFQRQILLLDVPWPQKNTLVVSILDIERFSPKNDGNRVILHVPERTPLQVTVTAAEGKALPDEVRLVTQVLDSDEDVQSISMGRAGGKAFFQHIYPPLLRSIAFHAEGGDDDDDVPLYEIRVARAPRVVRFWADYEYPEYTGLARKSLTDSNISAPEGTRLVMNFEVNLEMSQFLLEFEQLGAQSPTRGANGVYTFPLTITGNDFYTYKLTGSNGVTAADTPRYVVTCENDLAPRISVELPGSNSLLVTPEATLPMKGTASDDHGIAEIGFRYGAKSGELTDGSVSFQGEDLIGEAGARQLTFFSPVKIADLMLAARPASEGQPAQAARPLAEGDRFAFRFLATDNRKTAVNPEPHRAFSDSEISVQVLSSRDLQRELAQRQVRLRDRIKDLANLVEARIADTTSLIEAAKTESDQEQLRSRFWGVEQDQNRISIGLAASARQFQKVYDGYLWNRVDPGFLTEKLIDVLIGLHRQAAQADSSQLYGEALEKVRAQIDEAHLMGRLSVILDLLLRTSVVRSPEAYRRLARAGLQTARDVRIAELQGALEMQKLLREDVLLLVEKLEAWEDYLDVIQGFRDLLDAQKSIEKQIEKATK